MSLAPGTLRPPVGGRAVGAAVRLATVLGAAGLVVAGLALMGLARPAHAGPTTTGPAPETDVGVVDVPVAPPAGDEPAPTVERTPTGDAPAYLIWGLVLSVVTAVAILVLAWRLRRRTGPPATP